MDTGDISVKINATQVVRARRVIDYMEPARRVIMDFGEIGVTKHVDKGAPRVLVIRTVAIVHRVQMGIGDKVAIIQATLAATLNHANKRTAIVTMQSWVFGKQVRYIMQFKLQ